MRPLAVAVLGLTLALSVPVSAQQSGELADDSELAALRESLDQIVVLLRELVEQSSQRDSASLLLRRLEIVEQRLAPIEQTARTLRQRMAKEENELALLEQTFASISEMERADTEGTAADAFEAERSRVNASMAEKGVLIAEIARQLASLDEDIATRREAIDDLDTQLDLLLSKGDGNVTDKEKPR